MMPQIQVMPSILAAPVGRLEESCIQCEKAGADGLHIDVMDGHFVNNISFGPEVVRMARKAVDIHLSVHLMITRPDLYAEEFVRCGSDTLLIHYEADCDPAPVLRKIRELGARSGITINPETPAEAVQDLLDLVDEVLVMSVHPGFGGQAFIPEVLPKVAQLRSWKPGLDISIDGGINADTAEESAAYGSNILLAGSALFKLPDLAEGIEDMRARCREAFARKGGVPS